jgi:hypothetical protein
MVTTGKEFNAQNFTVVSCHRFSKNGYRFASTGKRIKIATVLTQLERKFWHNEHPRPPLLAAMDMPDVPFNLGCGAGTTCHSQSYLATGNSNKSGLTQSRRCTYEEFPACARCVPNCGLGTSLRLASGGL